MNRIFFCILAAIILLSSSACSGKTETGESRPSETKPESQVALEKGNELRGVWISFSELETAFKGNFYLNIDQMFDNISNLGFNTAYVHVRPFCDAFYESKIFPWSAYITGTEGVSPGFDPFEYITEAAHKRGIAVHAWINPYRISYSVDDPLKLSYDSPVRKYMTQNPDSSFAVGCNGGLYLNPANSDAEQLIVDGVKEILTGYDIEGIHFDDYFYPTTDESFDMSDYIAYTSSQDSPLPLADWRRQNVNRMLKSVYDTVKAYDSKIEFGVSPAGNNQLNYDELYADVSAWVDGGYVDYIIPQLYFGYNHSLERVRYDNLVYEWSKYTGKVTIHAGLGAYKIGAATGSEKEEWESGCILERMINYSRGYEYDGFVIFSYSSLFSEAPLNTSERQRISNLIGE